MAVALEQTETCGEVRVETGTGLVREVTHADGKRNAHVKIKATHSDLIREDVTAWADTFDSAVWPFVDEARADGIEVEYRIEVKRKGDVDRAIPIANLGNRQKTRELAAIARKGELSAADRIPPAQAATRPPQAAKAPTPPSAAPTPPGGSDGHEAAPAALRCELCNVDAATSKELLEHARGTQHKANEQRAALAARQQTAAEAASFDVGARERAVPPAPEHGRRRPRVEEAKPWELLNSDGSLNLASYSYQAVLGFVELAHDLVSQRVRDVIAAGDVPPELKLGQVEALAARLLEAADRCQAMTRADGRVDRMDASHTRARGAIRTALKVYPVPWGADEDTRAAWLENLSTHAASLTRIALDLFRLAETGEGR